MKTTQMHDKLKFEFNSVNSGSPFYYINNNLFSDPKIIITVPTPALH